MTLFTAGKEKEILVKLKSNTDLNTCLQYLYKEYFGFLKNMVLNNSGTKEDAEDVIQETFIAFVQIVQNDKYRGDSSLKSFLYSVAKNIWLTKLKKYKADFKRANIWIEDNPQLEDDIQEQLIKNEALRLISNVLSAIGSVCKLILQKYYYEELSLKEILDFTDFENEQVLRNKKSKCMKSLIEKLNEQPHLKGSLYKALRIF